MIHLPSPSRIFALILSVAWVLVFLTTDPGSFRTSTTVRQQHSYYHYDAAKDYPSAATVNGFDGTPSSSLSQSDGETKMSDIVSTTITSTHGLTATASITSEVEGNVRNLWDDNRKIPRWMKRYFSWHKAQREKIVSSHRRGETNWWDSHRYLVMRCLSDDNKCGGASDRLNQLPYMLMLANQTRRLLFLYWNRPCPLEEFLIPPAGGFNWTIPSEVLETFTSQLRGRDRPSEDDAGIITQLRNAYRTAGNATLVEARFFGSAQMHYYDHHREAQSELTFRHIYSEVWRIFFEPSRPVAARIRTALREHGLVKGQYVSAHVRAQYRENTTGNLEAVENAVRCAGSLRPGVPIFLASDSVSASRHAVEYGRRVLNHPVVSIVRDDPLLHIDRGSMFLEHDKADWDNYPPSAYYDTFVDLYLLGSGRCTSLGIGGYGWWASRISRYPRCYIRHDKNKCKWPIWSSSSSFSESVART
jgi:hypothetical protein